MMKRTCILEKIVVEVHSAYNFAVKKSSVECKTIYQSTGVPRCWRWRSSGGRGSSILLPSPPVVLLRVGCRGALSCCLLFLLAIEILFLRILEEGAENSQGLRTAVLQPHETKPREDKNVTDAEENSRLER